MPRIGGGFPPSFPQGRRPLWGGDRGSDRRQEPEPLSWGPQLIPSPGGRGLEGAGRRAGGAPRWSAHLSQPAQAQVKRGVNSVAVTTADSPARKAVLSTHLWSPGGWLCPSPCGVGSTRLPSPSNLFLPGSGVRHPYRP